MLIRTRGYFGRSLSSLSHRDFRYLAISTIALGFGQWFQMIGLGWLVYEVTGSAIQLAMITSVRGVLSTAGAPLGGILSDRFRRKNVMVISIGLACTQALALSALVFFGEISLWHLYVFAALEGLAAGLYLPASQALVFNVVPEESIGNAVALNSISQNLARILGPAIAGAIIGLTGSASAAFLMVSVFKLSAALISTQIGMVNEQIITTKGESAIGSLVSGVKYSFRDRTILALLIIGIVPSLLVYPYVQMLPFFAEDVLGRGANGYGLLATAVGWGALVGLAWLVFAGDVQRKGKIVLITLFFYVVFVAAFSQSRILELSMAFLIVAGVFHSVSMALTNTLFHLFVTDEFRGRVLSLYTMSHGIQPLGALPMGIAIEAWGPPNAISLFMMIACIVIVGVGVFAPALRRA